jgi:bacillopeptidase F (M6 metalloprotease family)
MAINTDKMPAKKIKINKIDIDSLDKTPVITLDKSTDYSLELISENIIKHITITDLKGNVIHESDINGNKFVFTYRANCKDMFLLNIRKQKQKHESQILIL